MASSSAADDVPADFMADSSGRLSSHRFDREKCTLEVLDQLLVPDQFVYVPVRNTEDAFDVIKKMQVRGAPLIATVAMFGLFLETELMRELSDHDLMATIEKKCAFLLSSRPTAVNLRNACDAALVAVRGAEPDQRINKLRSFILSTYDGELEENRRLLWHGLRELTSLAERKPAGEGLAILTICNTGSLATSSWGTALGIISALFKAGRLRHAIALETRPYLQGSRLTASELASQNIPFTLIADGMAASAMSHFKVDAVIVGADQVTRNGDTANKIGTCGLAVLAAHYGIPFYVALPVATFNPSVPDGSHIVIEERPPDELRIFNGKSICPAGIPVWNPAFDVTPGALVQSFITERGNFRPDQLGHLAELSSV